MKCLPARALTCDSILANPDSLSISSNFGDAQTGSEAEQALPRLCDDELNW